MPLLDDVAASLIAPASPASPGDARDPVATLLASLCERVRAAGVEVSRAGLSIHTLHPEVSLQNVTWAPTEGCVVAHRTHETMLQPFYLDSPPAAIHRGADRIRCRLVGPDAALRFPICHELAAAGHSDYLALAVVFRDGRRTFVSWATRRANGFTDEELDALGRLVPPLALRLELESVTFAMRSLLSVYLGPNAARRVLAGEFRRGEGESLHAVIWACDLRGFTSISDERPAREVVSLLDRYFETVGAPINEHGGEILKFIGDAVLALFPIDGDPAPVCGRALAAAEQAMQRIAELNASETRDASRIEIGLALHVGHVMYGNIGARDRLDFTVIGASVNEAFRVESLTKELGAPLLLTSAFAASAARSDLISVGEHQLRGVRQPQQLFTLPVSASASSR